MPKSSAELLVNGCTWAVYAAPIGTAFTASPTAPAAPWVDLGIIQEDPTVERTLEETLIEASNACAAVRQAIASQTIEFTFDLAQWTQATLEKYWGPGTVAGNVWSQNAALSYVETAMMLQLVDGTKDIRFRVQRASWGPDGETDFPTDDLSTMPVKVTALAPAAGAIIAIDKNTAWAVA